MDALAQRWHIAPSAVLAEPSWLVLGIMRGKAEPELPPAPALTDDHRNIMELIAHGE